MTLDLTLEEVNYILMSVGKNPYAECAPLVHKIHLQASPQIPVPVKDEEAVIVEDAN